MDQIKHQRETQQLPQDLEYQNGFYIHLAYYLHKIHACIILKCICRPAAVALIECPGQALYFICNHTYPISTIEKNVEPCKEKKSLRKINKRKVSERPTVAVAPVYLLGMIIFSKKGHKICCSVSQEKYLIKLRRKRETG